jgi:hypothetical protein
MGKKCPRPDAWRVDLHSRSPLRELLRKSMQGTGAVKERARMVLLLSNKRQSWQKACQKVTVRILTVFGQVVMSQPWTQSAVETRSTCRTNKAKAQTVHTAHELWRKISCPGMQQTMHSRQSKLQALYILSRSLYATSVPLLKKNNLYDEIVEYLQKKSMISDYFLRSSASITFW